MERITRDLRQTARSLARSPGSSLAAVLALALGIGATTAIFSLVHGVLLDGVPYRAPDRLVRIFEVPPGSTGRGIPVSPGSYHAWSQATDAFSGVALLRNESREFTARDEPLVPLTHVVTANYFHVLGVEPLLGRTFAPGEDASGRETVVILSHGLWRDAFGGDPAVVGRTVELDGREHTVVGVLRPDFYSDHNFATQPTGTGTEVDQPVGTPHHRLFVLNH